jgi:hypothetical protein
MTASHFSSIATTSLISQSLSVTCRNIDDELGELGWIAGPFAVAGHLLIPFQECAGCQGRANKGDACEGVCADGGASYA